MMILPVYLLGALSIVGQSIEKTPWSVRMVESEMSRNNPYNSTWGYVEGTVLKGVEEVWRTTGDNAYFQYIQNSLDDGFKSDGSLQSYTYSDFSLDEICEGRILLLMYKEGKNEARYQAAIDTLRKQLQNQPRVAEGGFWHRDNKKSNAYPHQMWLDGIYMANPFYAEYGLLFNEPQDFDDVITQLTVMENHARDNVTGLLYHGWDESKTQAWANPVTGCSPSFWGRADGWYAMAVVDVLDYLPSDYQGRAKAIAIIQRLAEALKKVQDPVYGTWYQVLDQGTRTGNYREASASCMFVYALAKAIRLGYIDNSYWDVVKKGYTGILNEFITINSDKTINLEKVCITAGLGGSNPYRDGTFDYYTKQTYIAKNDGKGVGPFILASIEVEKAELVVPPLNFKAAYKPDGVNITWTDKSYNATSFAIERKGETDNNFKVIAVVSKGETSFTDNDFKENMKYEYRARAFSESDSSNYSETSSTYTGTTSADDDKPIETGFNLFQNYPNPFNPETIIKYSIPSIKTGHAPSLQHVVLKVYNLLGKEVATLVNEEKSSGNYFTTFNATSLPSGIYFYTLSSGNITATKKLMLIK